MKTQVTWYTRSDLEPTRFEWSRDGVTWHEVKPTDVGPAETCYRGVLEEEPGYLRVISLQDGSSSNIMALPESAGLVAGLLLLCAMGGRRRAG